MSNSLLDGPNIETIINNGSKNLNTDLKNEDLVNIRDIHGPKTNKARKVPTLDVANIGYNYHNTLFGSQS